MCNGVIAPTEHEDERHLLHAYHYFAQEISQRIAHIDDKMTKALTDKWQSRRSAPLALRSLRKSHIT